MRTRSASFDLAALYFFAFGGLGAVLPFVPLLLESRGLSPTAVGFVMLLNPLANVFVPPLWGLLADAFHARVALLRATGVGCAIGSLALLPEWGLAGSVGAMAIYCFFRAPVIPLADAAAHAEIGADRAAFARIRVWGSVGFALFAAGVGALDGTHAPALMLGIAAAAYLASTAAGFRLRAPPMSRRPGVFLDTVAFLKRSTLPLLFLGCTFHYVGHGAYDVFFGLHLRTLGFGDGFVGAAWAVGVSFEIALMFYAPRLLRAVAPVRFLALGAIASIVRWMLLSELQVGWAILASQSLHALTFGLWYLSVAKTVQDHAPEDLRTSLQAAALASMGIGMIGGYVGGGRVYEALGGAAVFKVGAAASFLSLLTYLALAALDRRRALARA